MQDRERLKKRQLLQKGRQVNRDFTYRACLGQPQYESFSAPAFEILKVFIEALTQFRQAPRELYLVSVMYPVQIVSTPYFYVKLCLWNGFWKQEGKQSTHTKGQGMREEPPIAMATPPVQTGRGIFLITFPNNYH